MNFSGWMKSVFHTLQALSKKKDLSSQIAGLFGLRTVNIFLSLCLSITLTRRLGAEEFGIYSYAITLVQLLTLPATLGFGKLLIREISVYYSNRYWDLMKGLIKRANQLTFFFSLLLSLALICILPEEDYLHKFSVLDIALLSLPIASLNILRTSTLKGLKKINLGHFPEMINTPVLAIILINFYYFSTNNSITAYDAIVINFIIIIFNFIVGSLLVKGNLPTELVDISSRCSTSRWLSSSVPLMFLGGIQIFATKTDIIMLGILGDSESVGIYTVVNRLAQLITFMMATFRGALGPTIASLYNKGSTVELQRTITRSSRIFSLSAILVAILLIAFSRQILALFGSEFTAGIVSLVILSVGQLVNSVAGAVGLLLTMTNHEKLALAGFGVGALTNIVLNFILIPRFGLEGAAFATALSIMVTNTLNSLGVYFVLGINPTPLARTN